MARLSEVVKWFDAIFLSNPRLGEVCVFLGTGMTRSGEKSSPKRDDMVNPLFHTRSSEMG